VNTPTPLALPTQSVLLRGVVNIENWQTDELQRESTDVLQKFTFAVRRKKDTQIMKDVKSKPHLISYNEKELGYLMDTLYVYKLLFLVLIICSYCRCMRI
jgi:hypothetical protein